MSSSESFVAIMLLIDQYFQNALEFVLSLFFPSFGVYSTFFLAQRPFQFHCIMILIEQYFQHRQEFVLVFFPSQFFWYFSTLFFFHCFFSMLSKSGLSSSHGLVQTIVPFLYLSSIYVFFLYFYLSRFFILILICKTVYVYIFSSIGYVLLLLESYFFSSFYSVL